MVLEKLISADSHVVEPLDLWQKRIDKKFKGREPRALREGDSHRWVVDDSINLGSVGAPSQAGRRYLDLESLSITAGFEEVPAAAYDPDQRLEAMEVDGVAAEVVYSTIGTRLYTSPVEGELLSACFRAVNDWMAEFAGAHPDRIKGAALINLDNVQDGTKELQRCAKLGSVAAAIPTYPGEDNPYHRSDYDLFWATAQEIGMPLGMHAGSERPGPGRISIGDFAMKSQKRGDAAFRSTYEYWARRSVAEMLFGGVFERYPRLKVAVVEHDVGWVPHFVRRMDMTYKEHRYVTEIRFKGDKLPSDFIRTNVYFTFMEDPIFIPFRQMVGTDHIMWGSDYPHRESTWPRSRQVLGKLFVDVLEEDQRKLTFSNAAGLYGV